jgi:hypothetical protein
VCIDLCSAFHDLGLSRPGLDRRGDAFFFGEQGHMWLCGLWLPPHIPTPNYQCLCSYSKATEMADAGGIYSAHTHGSCTGDGISTVVFLSAKSINYLIIFFFKIN